MEAWSYKLKRAMNDNTMWSLDDCRSHLRERLLTAFRKPQEIGSVQAFANHVLRLRYVDVIRVRDESFKRKLQIEKRGLHHIGETLPGTRVPKEHEPFPAIAHKEAMRETWERVHHIPNIGMVYAHAAGIRDTEMAGRSVKQARHRATKAARAVLRS